jgi:hypothetical protein
VPCQAACGLQRSNGRKRVQTSADPAVAEHELLLKKRCTLQTGAQATEGHSAVVQCLCALPQRAGLPPIRTAGVLLLQPLEPVGIQERESALMSPGMVRSTYELGGGRWCVGCDFWPFNPWCMLLTRHEQTTNISLPTRTSMLIGPAAAAIAIAARVLRPPPVGVKAISMRESMPNAPRSRGVLHMLPAS